MMNIRRTSSRSPVSGERGPTNWDLDTHPAYRSLIRQARRAGRKAIPDPTRSTLAPSCFDALVQLTLDQLHHEMGSLIRRTASARRTVAADVHVEQWLADGDALDEPGERRLRSLRDARESIRIDVQETRTRVRSIVAVHNRVRAHMQDEYRLLWPYADHFQELVFPDLSLDDLSYADGDGGFVLADIMPAQPVGGSDAPRTRIREVLP